MINPSVEGPQIASELRALADKWEALGDLSRAAVLRKVARLMDRVR